MPNQSNHLQPDPLQKALFKAARPGNIRLLLISLILGITTACSPDNHDPFPSNETHKQYLSCYALEPASKSKCLQEFQFAAEKEGFKEFINNLALPCESVEESPAFIEEKQAYVVKCKPGLEYLMRFYYDPKEWKLIKGEE
jgi:hypothetical protein